MKNIIPAVKGTRDFYPETMAIRTWLYRTIAKVSERYGYQEYEGPYLERIDLYAAKSGEELVKEQSFVLQDRGGDNLTLRPELTPTLARMVAQRQNELAFPLRWWAFGPFWRYERPQKGRSREFFQWNIDMIGANSPEADAELVAICAAFFREVGLDPQKVKILVNDRRLMDQALAEVGIEGEQKKMALGLIDRRDKLPQAEWEAYALTQGLTAQQLSGLMKVLADPDLWKRSSEMTQIFGVLERMGLMEYVKFDAQIIRGLLYYTGLVFEAKDLDGGRSILGGGHYDNLVNDVGGDPVGAVGFAMGDVMIGVVLEKYGLLPQQPQVSAQVLVSVFDSGRLQKAYAFAEGLRSNGLKIIVYPDAVKLPKQMKYADRIGVRFVVIAGPDEEAAGQVTIKDLKERSQVTLQEENAADWLKMRLA